jgi:hypothetical protein
MTRVKSVLMLLVAGIMSAGLVGTSGAQALAAPAPLAAPTAVAAPAAPAPASAAPVVVTTLTQTSTPAVTPLAGDSGREGCWYHHSALTGYLKGVGTKLFVFETIVNWCGRSGRMTRVTSQMAYFSHLAGAVSVTRQPHTTLYKPATTFWVSRSEASVKFCFLRIGCVASYNPWISTTMHGNGSRTSIGGF